MTRLFVLCVLLCAATAAFAQDATSPPGALAYDPPLRVGPAYVVPVDGMIDKGLTQYIDRALSEAEAEGAALVIFHVNTFGGLVDAADEIRQRILRADVPTLAFVDHNAISAGALISYAADKIVMAPGGTFGAATVVEGMGGEAAPDKYQSAMRALMRTTAEENGRDPRIAEAMVDERIAIDGVTEEGEVLTLSSDEALRLGVADAVLPDIEAVVEAAGLEAHDLVAHDTSALERTLRFFGSPVLQSILMLMMMGGLYFELQSPGVGFPGLMAALGALAFFAPSYALGLVESWEVVLFFIGILLLAAEIFVLPGFGIAGITGGVLVIVSLGFALIANVGLAIPEGELRSAIWTMAVTLVLLVLLIFSVGRYMPQSKGMNRLVLQDVIEQGETTRFLAYAAVGQRGLAVSTLRPSGTVELDGRRVDAVSTAGFVPPGTPVEVVQVFAGHVAVQPVVPSPLPA